MSRFEPIATDVIFFICELVKLYGARDRIVPARG